MLDKRNLLPELYMKNNCFLLKNGLFLFVEENVIVREVFIHPMAGEGSVTGSQ